MAVEYGSYADDAVLEDGTLVADHRDAWLISDTELEADEAQLSEIDHKPGRIRIHQLADDEIGYTEMTFESFHLARLAFGLWERCGPFTQPEGNAVPIKIATDGQAAIAAYLRLGNGYPNSREYVAEKMRVTEQTVSNYCNKVKWTPDSSE